MSFLSCVNHSTSQYSTVWSVCYGLLFGFSFVLFLYGLVPMIRSYRLFAAFTLMNQATRIAITITLFIKSIGHLGVIIVGRLGTDVVEPDFSKQTLYGVILLEWPTYLVSSCYTLVLLFWLLICLQLLPLRYSNIFKRMKVVLLAYNIAIYLIYFASFAALIFFTVKKGGPNGPFGYILGFGEFSRDIVLCIIFGVFSAFLKLGLSKVDGEESPEERRLLLFSVVLMVVLVARGLLPLFQGIKFFGSKAECDLGMCAWQFIVALVCDGLPLWWLLYINNQFLLYNQAMGLDSRRLSTGTMPNE
jgi:hypothetical protein